jgi:Uma2 family endonuclease
MLGKQQVTPAELLKMPDAKRFELVDGELVERNMSFHSGWVTSLLNEKLTAYVRARQLGAASSEASYQCFAEDPDRVRRPNISFIQRSRVTPSMLSGHVPIPPDLAIEIVSDNDTLFAVRRKIGEYLRAGVRLVWVVNPEEREVQVFRGDGKHSLIQNGDSLDGEDVVPGFHCPLAETFAPPPMGPTG